MIFTFGSNLSGIHGAGSARFAYKYHGAKLRVGEGHVGNSYALPTKGINIIFMPIYEVEVHINKFIKYAETRGDLGFQVTRVGCGLAGFKDEEIAPLFIGSPKNCFFDTKWRNYLTNEFEYWGTFP